MSERTGEEIWAAVGRASAGVPEPTEEPKVWRPYVGGPPRPSKAEAEAAVAETGSVRAAARKLGCNHRTVRKSLGRDPSGSGLQGANTGLTPELVRAAVDAANGNQTEAARVLGCSPTVVRHHLGLSRSRASGNHRGQHLGLTYEQVGEAYSRAGTYTGAARELGCTKETVREHLGLTTNGSPTTAENFKSLRDEMHPHRLNQDVLNGTVLIGSDAHIWPGHPPTTAMRAFKAMITELQPKMVIMNGDVFDGAQVSRFPSIGWEKKPDVVDEIAACQMHLREIRALMPAESRAIWTLGNHDMRFEVKIANTAPEFKAVHGVHLKDHFPEWESCWSIWLNHESRIPVIVKHRFRNGTHARHNNTLHAGMSIVTGHTHNLGVTPFSDYHGTRYGVDTGTLAIPYGPQFVHYTEDNPVNWRSGFAVLTFEEGRLLFPQLVFVENERQGTVSWKGETFQV